MTTPTRLLCAPWVLPEDLPAARPALDDTVSFYKIGYQLVFAGGLEFARDLAKDGKKVFLEEWGIDQRSNNIQSAFPSEIAEMNRAGLPSVYWQIMPAQNGGCSYNPQNDAGDPFGIFAGGSVSLAGINAATGVEAAQDWTGTMY